MNDETTTLESRLRDLPLAHPSSQLDARIEMLLGSHASKPDRSESWRLAFTLAAGIAAAAVLAMSVLLSAPIRMEHTAGIAPIPRADSPHALDPFDSFNPIRIENVVSQTTPDRLLYTDDAQPLRPIHMHTVHHTQWIDEANNVRIELTEPRERTYYITPVAD